MACNQQGCLGSSPSICAGLSAPTSSHQVFTYSAMPWHCRVVPFDLHTHVRHHVCPGVCKIADKVPS